MFSLLLHKHHNGKAIVTRCAAATTATTTRSQWRHDGFSTVDLFSKKSIQAVARGGREEGVIGFANRGTVGIETKRRKTDALASFQSPLLRGSSFTKNIFLKNVVDQNTLATAALAITTRLYQSSSNQQQQQKDIKEPQVEISPANHNITPLTTFSSPFFYSSTPQNKEEQKLHPLLLQALSKQKFNTTTPIQAHAIPLLLQNHDIMASAVTGSGKTLMFAIPMIQKLLTTISTTATAANTNKRTQYATANPRALIISPTRELAQQTASVLSSLRPSSSSSNNDDGTPNLKIALATGGEPTKKQRSALKNSSILVGTPGRILQFLDERSTLSFSNIDLVVVDEADRMLDLGFEPQLRRIQRELVRASSTTSGDRSTTLCSATFPPDVQRIASEFLKPNYYFVAVGRVGATHGGITQDLKWVDGDGDNVRRQRQQQQQQQQQQHRQQQRVSPAEKKRKMVINELINFYRGTNDNKKKDIKRSIVFVNTKDEAENLYKSLCQEIAQKTGITIRPQSVQVVHGDKPQAARNKSLSAFRSGKIVQVLIATDVASRGLDVDDIRLVIQADAPRDIDTWVHRVGRTGRGDANAEGKAISFVDGKCMNISPDLVQLLEDANQDVPVWLRGMSYVKMVRVLEEEGAIAAGGGFDLDTNAAVVVSDGDNNNHNGGASGEDQTEEEEGFTKQDFRSSAAAGSWGSARDTTYRSFEEEAYRSLDDDVSSSASDMEEDRDYSDSGDDDTDGEMEDAVQLDSSSDDDDNIGNTSLGTLDSAEEEESMSAPIYQRPEPSHELRNAIKRILKSNTKNKEENDTIGDTPNPKILSVLSRRGSNQRLRFEYLGMFSFDDVQDLLMSSSSQGRNQQKQEQNQDGNGEGMTRVLMVAEKPSIAKAIAEALSGPRGPRQRRGISRALPVYEFTSNRFRPNQCITDGDGDDDDAKISSSRSLITVTSVVGHVFSLAFEFGEEDKQGDNGNNDPSSSQQQEEQQNKRRLLDPSEYFKLPVVKQEETSTGKLRVVDHLRALAAGCDHLVLWLDCDAEGENIAYEVIGVTRRALDQRALATDQSRTTATKTAIDDTKLDQNSANTSTTPTRRVHRARFSAITKEAIQDAFDSLCEPDPALSRSVDARQELDLRVGVALTRLLTWRCVGSARKHFSPSTKMVSYGPCQTPALSFCVDRAKEIEKFRSTNYWKVQVTASTSNIVGSASGNKEDVILKWKLPGTNSHNRSEDEEETHILGEDSATFDQITAEQVVKLASAPGASVTVISVDKKSERIMPPLGLNTVGLLTAGSKAMGMSPKQVMNVAEKLYSAGYISYPRTETTKYDPNGFDVRSILRDHAPHPEWGRTATHLLHTKYANSGLPPRRGVDRGDHPPITCTKDATREEVGGGAAWRVYEFVARNFLGSLGDELQFTRRIAVMGLDARKNRPPSKNMLREPPLFQLEQVSVDTLGFAGACRWVLRDIGAVPRMGGNKCTPDKGRDVIYEEGMVMPITNSRCDRCATKPPPFLQEHELIELMDKNRIGTDASMATHVNNIVDRGYVVLCDETGTPLRPPRPPVPGQRPKPRQIGRYLVPTPLGIGLIDLFGENSSARRDKVMSMANLESHNNHEKLSPALLSRPAIRAQMENEVAQIASSSLDKDSVVAQNLAWFEARYNELEASLSRTRINEFSKSLTPTKSSLRYWKSLGAFKSVPTKQQEGGNSRRTGAKSKKLNQNSGGRKRGYKRKNRSAHIASAKSK